MATKSNGIAISMPWWDGRADAIGRDYPDVTVDKQHIDILCARFVLQPQRFDVVVATNLFGDILSDLGPACTGTIGLAPSANLNPERKFPSLFEPVHGSAPDIYGKNIANPIAMIWSGALMLDFLDARPGRRARRARRDRRGDRARARAGPAHAATSAAGLDHRARPGDRRRLSQPPERSLPFDATDMPLTLQRDDLLPGRNFIGATGATPRRPPLRRDATRPPTPCSPACPTAARPTRAPRSTPRMRAFPAWRAVPAKQRAQILKRWNDLILAHQEDLGRLISREQGKPLAEGRGEVAYARELRRVVRRGGDARQRRHHPRAGAAAGACSR